LDNYSIVYLDPGQFIHVSCPGYPEIKLSFPWGIGKKIQALAPDYIHIATEGPIGLFARFYLDKFGYRYNTSYHTKFPEFLKKIYHIPEFLTWAYLRWFHKHSGIVLTNTTTMVDDLYKNKFSGAVKPWTRGVNREDLKSTEKFVKGKTPLILYVGRVSREKGIDDVCVLADIYNVVVVGDGPYRKELQTKYPDVSFVGYQQSTDLANWYAKADVLVFPSRVDTFGLVMIEAMSLGTPVAAYPVPGPLDIIDCDTGSMNEDLKVAITQCLKLNRDIIKDKSKQWTWGNCWNTFKQNLVEII